MDKVRCAGILGTGSYVPEKVVTNDEWIVTRTGIHTRHIAASGEAASDMAAEAGRRALERAGIFADQISFMMVATGTPDYPIPFHSRHSAGETGSQPYRGHGYFIRLRRNDSWPHYSRRHGIFRYGRLCTCHFFGNAFPSPGLDGPFRMHPFR